MTKALDDELDAFRHDLSRHHLFLTLERRIKNPASKRSRPRSETLLSAYIVLSCGRFELYLQRMFFLSADDLRQRPFDSQDARIPKIDKFHRQNLMGFIHWATRANGLSQADLSLKIHDYSVAVAAGHIFSESFSYTDANPKTETVKGMFSRFGIEDSFSKIEKTYNDGRGRRLSKGIIETTLDNFVNRRHEAAHHGRIPNVTRADAEDDHTFIIALAEAIRAVLSQHLAAIV